MATPHNEANKGDIAKTVIMLGDPLRAKHVADKYLENVKLVNSIRCMYAYTGTYKGKEITVMAHGMGMPSAGIYFHELYKFYDVERIIRLGTCGAYIDDLNLFDIILVDNSYTESNYAYTLNNEHVNISSSSKELTDKLEETSKKINIDVVRGNVTSTDCFDWYMTNPKSYYNRIPKELNVIAAEMESFALFYITKLFNKEAACLLTVVDSHAKKEELTAADRQTKIDNMILIALESIL